MKKEETYIHHGPGKKRAILLLPISLPVIDLFSKFFHWHTVQTICNNVTIMYLTAR